MAIEFEGLLHAPCTPRLFIFGTIKRRMNGERHPGNRTCLKSAAVWSLT